MKISKPFNLLNWIEEHRDQLRPPVGNATLYQENDDFIVMVVGGPNARKDFHIDQGEELFYQLEGSIEVGLQEADGSFVTVALGPGDMMLVPGGIPHQPRRPAGSVGLVIERYRKPGEHDGFVWFCENCSQELHRAMVPVADIVKDLPLVMNAFWADLSLRTCKNCVAIMEPPALAIA